MVALYIILSIILLIYILLRCSVVVNVNLTPEEKQIKIKYLFFTIFPLKEKIISDKKKQRLKKKKAKKREKLAKKIKREKAKLLKKKKKILKKQKDKKPLNKKRPETISHKMTDNFSQNKLNETENLADNKEEFSKEKPTDEKPEGKEKIPLKKRIEDLKEKWEKIKPYIPTGWKAVKRIIKSIRVDDINLYYLVTDEDAYECAMKYGKTNIVVSNALGLLSTFLTISVDKINIATKFNSNETEYKLSCKIKTRPSTILAIGIACLVKMIYVYLKQSSINKKGDAVNE